MKSHSIWLIIAILCCLSQSVNAAIDNSNNSPFEKGMIIQTDVGIDVLINASLPDSPSSLTVYKGAYDRFGQIEKVSPERSSTQSDLPADSEAPGFAQQALEQYGGLPSDAILDGIRTDVAYGINPITRDIEETYPQCVEVSYSRSINGIPITGQWNGESIYIELGNNGKLLYLIKKWRTWIPDHEERIINASQAIERLKHGELNLKQSEYLEISRIRLIYYGLYPNRAEGFLEPAWVFDITKPASSSGSAAFTEHFYISASEGKNQIDFADFSATPISGRVPLSVQFQDTSVNNRVQLWLWDFGDGNTSTEHNPTHTYSAPGKYTVILESLDEDRGSTAVKKDFITVRNPASPGANFTANPLTGEVPLTVTFNDTSSNGPTSWLWSFGDGATSTEESPTHTYTAAGNYTVRLDTTNADGTGTVTKTDLITVSVPQTTIPTTNPTTRPTPRPTRQPLPPVVAVAGAGIAMLFFAMRKK